MDDKEMDENLRFSIKRLDKRLLELLGLTRGNQPPISAEKMLRHYIPGLTEDDFHSLVIGEAVTRAIMWVSCGWVAPNPYMMNPYINPTVAPTFYSMMRLRIEEYTSHRTIPKIQEY